MVGVVSFIPLVSMAQLLSDEPYEPGGAILYEGGYQSSDNTQEFESSDNTQEFESSDNTKGSKTFRIPLKSPDLISLVREIIKVVRIFVVPIVVLFIIYGGFLLATAGGNPTKISTGKTTITWALIGGVIVIGAELILAVIQSTLSTI